MFKKMLIAAGLPILVIAMVLGSDHFLFHDEFGMVGSYARITMMLMWTAGIPITNESFGFGLLWAPA